MSNFVVKVSNLVKTFDTKKIIKNISFNVNENSVTGVLGKNGAGKTTLLGMLMGLISPSSGNIEILGKNLFFKKNEILKDINFQSPYIDLPKKMTVEQNLFFYSRLYGIKKFKDIIYDLVKKLKMSDLMKKNYLILTFVDSFIQQPMVYVSPSLYLLKKASSVVGRYFL